MNSDNFVTPEKNNGKNKFFPSINPEGPYNFFPAKEEDKDLLIWRYGNKFKTSVEFRHFIHDTELKGKSARAIKNDPFLRALKQIDYDKCRHIDGNQSCIAQDKKGKYYCTKCGMHFKLSNSTRKQIKNITDNFTEILDDTKIMYLSLDPISSIYNCDTIPHITKKFPELVEIAANDFKKHNCIDNASMPETNNIDEFKPIMNPGITNTMK